MKKKQEFTEEIRKEFNEIGKRARTEYMELRGLDIKKQDELEAQMDAQRGKLIDRVHKFNLEKVKEAAKKLERTYEMNARLQFAEAVNELVAQARELDYISVWCGCFDPTELIFDRHCPEEGAIIATSNVEHSLAYDDENRLARAYIKASGVSNTTNSAEITGCFVYRYPWEGDEYRKHCIEPDIQLNGYYLVWPWNRGGCTGESLTGGGKVKVELNVTVSQSEEIKKETGWFTVLEEDVGPNFETEGPLFYDSREDPSKRANLKAYLDPNEHATVVVWFKLTAEITNGGKAILDFGSTNETFIKVPAVTASLYWCPWIWNRLDQFDYVIGFQRK